MYFSNEDMIASTLKQMREQETQSDYKFDTKDD